VYRIKKLKKLPSPNKRSVEPVSNAEDQAERVSGNYDKRGKAGSIQWQCRCA
jgi:hypothetical protein